MTGLIFDFNGTLFRDSDKHEQAWIDFAKKISNKDLSESDVIEHIHGRNNYETITYLLGQDIGRTKSEELAEEKEAHYRKLALADTENLHLVEGAIDLFNQLKANQIPFTIATASGYTNTVFYFETFGLNQWFDFDKVVYNDGNLAGKPDPDPYLLAAEKINVPIGECIVIEDSPSGIQSGINAKAKWVIGVTTNNNATQLKNLGADMVIDNFNDPSLRFAIGL